MTLDRPLSVDHDGAMPIDKPYRFVLTLDQETRRHLAHLQAQSIDAAGRMKSAAEIVRGLILAAPIERAPGVAGKATP